jgi:glycosyltransferase involved in cell wall biosynthesis
MPVFNAEAHVKEAVESVLNQNYSDFDVLIIDDGSTDKSIEIIKEFEDSRIKIHSLEQNKGLVNALNVGLSMIDTDYIARTDADDVCLPDRLKVQVEFMDANQDVGAVGTGFDSLLPDGSIKSGGRFSPDHNSIRLKHLYIIQIIHGTSMLRTKVIRDNDLRFDQDFKHAEDYDFFDRLSSVSQIANIPEPHYLIRQHDQRVSTQFSSIQKDNSDRVKLRIMKQIGVDASVDDLEILQWMMYQNYDWYDLEKALRLSELIDKICSANEKSKYLPPDYLRSELGTRFMHFCNSFSTRSNKVFSLLWQNKSWRLTDNPRLVLAVFLRSTFGLSK